MPQAIAQVLIYAGMAATTAAVVANIIFIVGAPAYGAGRPMKKAIKQESK